MGEEVEKLKPCPFCGGSARTHTYDTESLFSHAQVAWLTIECMDCDILMSSEQHDEVRAAWNRRAAKAEESSVSPWRQMTELPEPNRRIVLLYGDGSGGGIYFHAEGGLLYDGEDGCSYSWASRTLYTAWTYLPPGYRLWVEDCADDPMTLPADPTPPKA